MASRAPRQLLTASLRASARSQRANVFSSSRRPMSSTAETAKKGSDLPWMIGSVVVFGPAFIYLVSPASRKSAPHHPHHETESVSHHSMPMKDDEGTETDVAESVHKAESEDVPKADSADKEPKEDETKEDKTEETPESAAPTDEAKKESEPVRKDPAGTKEEPGPTEQGQVRGKATHPDPESPKSVDEKAEAKKENEKKSDQSS